ncbi:hypothetical protein SAY87_002904 [Trapa incisa]|uniref:SWIRM domain-containing protein n=1 Tax=Trapa incisa TaxID=236973 RepID=A0AAN7QIA5_9MYRT|nr:hypothetical protein SAY87_002904 [Trapa incisa]
MYSRYSIIKLYRQNPSKKTTFTDERKTIIGDVGSIRKVFDFLETWGLINYPGLASSKPLKWDDKAIVWIISRLWIFLFSLSHGFCNCRLLFLSALAGVEVAQAAAQAAVTTLSEVDHGVSRENLASTIPNHAMSQDGGLNPLEGALIEANSLLEKEEQDLEKAIWDIAEVQV